jgi:hypothetical protein
VARSTEAPDHLPFSSTCHYFLTGPRCERRFGIKLYG